MPALWFWVKICLNLLLKFSVVLSDRMLLDKIFFRIRFATAKPCFALQVLPPPSGRHRAATQATPSEVLGWRRANSANAYWTLYTITLAHTILGIWYATLKETQENNPQEDQASVERFCDIQTLWVGLGGSRLQWIFSDKCKQKAICSAVAHQKVWIFF